MAKEKKVRSIGRSNSYIPKSQAKYHNQLNVRKCVECKSVVYSDDNYCSNCRISLSTRLS